VQLLELATTRDAKVTRLFQMKMVNLTSKDHAQADLHFHESQTWKHVSLSAFPCQVLDCGDVE